MAGQGPCSEGLSRDSLDSDFSNMSSMLKKLFCEDEFITALERCVEKILAKRLKANEDRLERQEGELHELRVQLDQKEAEIQSLSRSLNKITVDVDTFNMRANDLEQYSRRNSIRIFGIPESQGEDTDQAVIKAVSDNLPGSISLADIDRSHRSGKPRADAKKPRPILVKLTHYRKKAALMKDRRRLKGTGVSIQEDLTKANHQILMKLANHPKVEAAWSIDGKIMAALKTSEEGITMKRAFSTLQQVSAL